MVNPTITTTATRKGVNSEDAAEFLGISVGSIYVLIAKGAITPIDPGLPGDRHLLLYSASLIAYRRQRRHNTRWHGNRALAEVR